MGNYWTTPVSHPEDVGVQYLRRTLVWDQFGYPSAAASGIPIGAYEAGSIPLHCNVTIETAFNGGTNSLIVGTPEDDDGFATAAAIAAGAAGFKGNLSGALSGLTAASDKVVYAKFAQTGSPASAGKAHIVVAFVPRRTAPVTTNIPIVPVPPAGNSALADSTLIFADSTTITADKVS